MCACNLERFEGTGNILVLWQHLLLSLRLLGNWIKIIVFRIANPYNILRQITNLPQLRTTTTTGQFLLSLNNISLYYK
jgi:hypothetical protein